MIGTKLLDTVTTTDIMNDLVGLVCPRHIASNKPIQKFLVWWLVKSCHRNEAAASNGDYIYLDGCVCWFDCKFVV